jgi:DNA mismatch repair protein MLH1
MAIAVTSSATTVDRIRQIHGSSVANELIHFEATNDKYGFKVDGWASNANYHVKRTTILLFINHRAVESSALKKALEQTYSQFLPKGTHPFIYLSLDIEPHRVDVNVHPTKREVNFLYEDEIVEKICDEVRGKLAAVDTSRTFMTQSILPGAKVPTTSTNVSSGSSGAVADGHQFKKPATKPYENNLVRTDARARKITSMLPTAQAANLSTENSFEKAEEIEYEYTDRQHVSCRLTSIKALRAEVRERVHNDLTEVFAGHTFVGIVDESRRLAAIQGGVKLFLVDYGMLCEEYFYQVGLTDFGNFGHMRFDPPLDLRELLAIALKAETEEAADTSDIDSAEVINMVVDKLLGTREMLSEYFSMEISEEGMLSSLPILMKGYMPSLAKLPRFLLRLGPCVDWTDEKDCFRTFLGQLAAFYVPESLPAVTKDGKGEGDAESSDIVERRKELNRAVETLIFPAFRARLLATTPLLNGVVEVANLKGLYRVFERC